MKEYQRGTTNRIQNWRVGKLLHQSEHLCWFSQKLCCNICKGKADEREPSNDDRAMLKELGITAMGEALSSLKQPKEPSTQTIYAKVPSAKLPQLHFEMTFPPTIQKILNRLGIVHQNDRHANFSNHNPISTPTLNSSPLTQTGC